MKNLLFARAFTQYHYDYHVDAVEHSCVSRIFIEKYNTRFILKNVSNVFSLELGDADKLENNDTFRLIVRLVTVGISMSFHVFPFQWSVLDKDMFFWHTAALKFKTPYVVLSYYYEKAVKDTKFDKPPKILIKLNGELQVTMRSDGVTVPKLSKQWDAKIMDRYIRAYRVLMTDEMKGSMFTIYLNNITNLDRLRVRHNFTKSTGASIKCRESYPVPPPNVTNLCLFVEICVELILLELILSWDTTVYLLN